MASPERIHEIIDFVTTDAYNDDEVMSGWDVALSDASARPFPARALGKPVSVLSFDADPRHGLRCEVQGEGVGRRLIGIDALDFDSLPEAVREVLEGYEAWSEGDY